MKLHKEVKVALFVIIAGTMLYTGFNFLKGIDFFSTTNSYYAEYDNVEGLTVSNPVVMNGFNVGRVSQIIILNDSNQTLKVTLDIDKSVVIGDSTSAIITNQSLIGGKAILLKIGNINKPLPENSKLLSGVEKSLSDKISEKTAPIISSLDTTLQRVNSLISQKNVRAISSIISHLDQTSQALNKLMDYNSVSIAATTGNLAKLSASLVETEKQLKPILSKANTFADSLNKMQVVSAVDNANKAIVELNKLLAGLNNGEGTAGKLLHNDSLYIYLNNTSRDLDKLMIDLKANPKRYVHFSLFGKKEKK